MGHRGPRHGSSVKIRIPVARIVLLFRLRMVLDRRSDVVMRIRGLMLLSLLLILAPSARIDAGTTLQDLVRLKGHDRVFLQGLGIVVGLEGTGDTSKNSWVAAKPYAMLLENLGDPVSSLDQLEKADAYAIVYVSMEVPAFGAVDGDQLDVTIETIYNATSLKGGRLVFSPLRLPAPHAANPPIMAFAQGSVVLEGADLTSGRIRNGGQMVRDIKANPISGDRVQLILKDEYAGWPMADRLAGIVNANFDFTGVDRIAAAENAKSVHVLLPTADRTEPAPFLAALLSTPVDPSLIDVGARIVVNERTGTILVNEDVEIGPVAVAHDGLTITSLSPAAMTPGAEGLSPADWVGIDARQEGAGSSMHLNTLLEALRRFNVPVKEQIEILYELRRSGALHAEIIDE
jgi:flagellar P-ring protein precursor FlgI